MCSHYDPQKYTRTVVGWRFPGGQTKIGAVMAAPAAPMATALYSNTRQEKH